MNLTFVKKPHMEEYTILGASDDQFAKNIVKDNKVSFNISFKTKTYLYISVFSGRNRFNFNERSDYAMKNNIKFAEKTEMNYFSGQAYRHYYFVYNKKQNKEILEKHLLSLTERLLTNILHINELVNLDTFEINVQVPEKILEA